MKEGGRWEGRGEKRRSIIGTEVNQTRFSVLPVGQTDRTLPYRTREVLQRSSSIPGGVRSRSKLECASYAVQPAEVRLQSGLYKCEPASEGVWSVLAVGEHSRCWDQGAKYLMYSCKVHNEGIINHNGRLKKQGNGLRVS